ncbi:MAG: acyltransferase family protein [Flavobacteriaceae bacterium]
MAEQRPTRLYFIDAMRAWAILMMLQGHFIDGLLDPVFRDPANALYRGWLYFRGITAPVFFTVSGFIFTYLLVRNPRRGWDNPRVRKGIRRGLQLILIGYLLRLNVLGLFKGQIYGAFWLVDVLHCIGFSILGVIAVYVLTIRKGPSLLLWILLGLGVVLFLFEPIYKVADYSYLPSALANYLSKANGSVFTIIPWMGYAFLGGVLSLLFTRYGHVRNLYAWAIGISVALGCLLIFKSSALFTWLHQISGVDLFQKIVDNNYLFIRLGDVFLVFAVFMLLRKWLTHGLLVEIGQNTLSIYVIHFIILYGSFTGFGLYRFFHHSLAPSAAITGAMVFMFVCTWIALWYDRHEIQVKTLVNRSLLFLWNQLKNRWRNLFNRILGIFGLARN